MNGTDSLTPLVHFHMASVTQADKDMDPKLRELDAYFVFKTWRFTGAEENARKFMEICENGADIESHLVSFFRGHRLKMDADDFILFLKRKPDAITGKFVIGLMIVTVASQLSIPELIMLYEARHDLAIQFQDIIQKVTLFLLQRNIQNETSKEILLDTIPRDLLLQLNLDFLVDFSDSTVTINYGPETSMLTRRETQSISSIATTLTELMFPDLEKMDLPLLDYCFTPVERLEIWTPLINRYIFGETDDKRFTFFELLLMQDVKKRIGTKVYFVVNNGEDEFSVHLHKSVVQRFAKNSSCSPDVILEATREDMEVLTSLLYLKYDLNSFKGKISYGVFKMAKQLNIDDMKYFLFRGNDYHLFLDDTNKKDMFHILLEMSQVNEAAVNFKTWFTEQNQSKSLNGLPAEIIINFLECKNLQLSQLEVYKLLVQWSFADCGKSCGDELKTTCDNDVYESFKKVRKVLRLVDLRKHFPQMCLQKFITIQDIKDANTIALFKNANLSKVSESTWFRTK